MKYSSTILKANTELSEEIKGDNQLEDFIKYFKSFNWDEELEKDSQIYSPTYEISTEDSSKKISFSAISNNAFLVFYSYKYAKINAKKVIVKVVEFEGDFDKNEVVEILSKFINKPEDLLKYKVKGNTNTDSLSSFEKLIGWGAYGLILFVLLFVEYKVISEHGITRPVIILFVIICLVTFIMLRFRPKKS